ncbi:MAG: PAS domain S-box protein [Chloroflexota bacterium]|nr:PAS domain S-box protein [Dehalococcoidia bacterium]MDW8252670.1 PAS domain S-box protein [Chloroflexota bacterium]
MRRNRSQRGLANARSPRRSGWRFRRYLGSALPPALDHVIALIPDPFLIVGLDGRILGWNAAAERLYGYAAEEIIGASIVRLAPPGHPDDLALALDRYFQGLPPQPVETVRLRKDGTPLAVRITLSPVRSRAGRLTRIAVLHRALADPRGVLSEHDDQLAQAVLDGAPVGVHWVREDGTILWANRAKLEMLGYAADEYIGRNLAEFAVDPDAVRTALGRVRGGDVLRNVEIGLRAKNGALRTMLVSSTACRQGDAFVHTSCFSVDITERNDADAQLRAREQQFRTVVEKAPVFIWMTAPDATITFLSRPWFDFTGRPLDEAFGDGWVAAIHPDDLPAVLDRYCQAFDRREPYVVEYRLRRRDGAYRWMLDRGMPLVDPAGEFAGYLGAAVDITEFREAAEERARAAARDGRVEGVLLTAREMSHLLNNSITSAIGSLELLAYDPTNERYQALIPGALASLETAARYLRDLQNIVRVETKQTAVGEALDLGRSTA